MTEPEKNTRVGCAVTHESAQLHVTGEARFVDDLPELRDTLYAAIGMSARAHARIRGLDLSAVEQAQGVVAVLGVDAVPGSNEYGLLFDDDPIFAEDIVEYAGQSIFAVVARSVEQARRAAKLARIDLAACLSRCSLSIESSRLPSRSIAR